MNMQSQPWLFEEQIAWNHDKSKAQSTVFPSTDELSEHLKCSKCKQSHCKISNCIFIDELSESPQWSKRKGLQSTICLMYQLMNCQNVCIAPNARTSDDKSTVAHQLMSSQNVNHALNARESQRKFNVSVDWWAFRTTVILWMEGIAMQIQQLPINWCARRTSTMLQMRHFLLKTETCVHQQMTYQNIRNALMATNRNEKSTAVCQLMSAHIGCNVPSARDRNEN